jgi:hypothetical protein
MDIFLILCVGVFTFFVALFIFSEIRVEREDYKRKTFNKNDVKYNDGDNT